MPCGTRHLRPDWGFPWSSGPVGGSLKSPAGFVAEEGATPWWQRLRRLDAWRLAHDPLLRRTYESAACVFGVAEYVREFLGDVDLKRFELMSETAVRPFTIPFHRADRHGAVRLLYVGRIVRTKGLRDIIRALAINSDLDVRLDVVGDGNDRDACEPLVTELGLEDRVTFHGKIPRARVDDFYEKADIFVFPSYREPGGNVALEAMAFGLPLIVCRVGGPGRMSTTVARSASTRSSETARGRLQRSDPRPGPRARTTPGDGPCRSRSRGGDSPVAASSRPSRRGL